MMFLVVMGVSGSGKSTLGAALSHALQLPFIDGDALHSPSHIAKMSRGEPLTDTDRQGWLEAIRKTAEDCLPATEHTPAAPEHSPVQPRDEVPEPGIIVACSSLKAQYRSVLRGETPSEREDLRTLFVYLTGPRHVLMDRMNRRQGHFMQAAMLDSQLDTLESPEHEDGVVTVSIEWSTEDQVQEVVRALKDRSIQAPVLNIGY